MARLSLTSCFRDWKKAKQSLSVTAASVYVGDVHWSYPGVPRPSKRASGSVYSTNLPTSLSFYSHRYLLQQDSCHSGSKEKSKVSIWTPSAGRDQNAHPKNSGTHTCPGRTTCLETGALGTLCQICRSLRPDLSNKPQSFDKAPATPLPTLQRSVQTGAALVSLGVAM